LAIGGVRFGAQFPTWAPGSTVPWCGCQLRKTKPACSQSSGAQSLEHASGSWVLWHCCQGNWACWLAPSVNYGAMGAMRPAYRGALVSLAFQGEVAGFAVGGPGAPSSCVCWATGFTTE
jgi:hypothetical protein